MTISSEDQWPSQLADYIRHNDEAMLKASDRLLACYREELLPCTSFEEFCDILGLYKEISSCDTYVGELLKGLA